MINQNVKQKPKSLNCDFEKAIHRAANKVWPELSIHGCFFHMCQNWLKRVKTEGLMKSYLSDANFVKSFRLCQSLAYIPIDEVQIGFEEIKLASKSNFEKILTYLSKNYIGTKSKDSRFPIKTWNLYERTLHSLPGTNNEVESLHGSFTDDTKSNPTIPSLVQELRLEQSRVEADILFIDTGREVVTKSTKRKAKELRIKNMVMQYRDYSRFKFLELMSLNLGSFEIGKKIKD